MTFNSDHFHMIPSIKFNSQTAFLIHKTVAHNNSNSRLSREQHYTKLQFRSDMKHIDFLFTTHNYSWKDALKYDIGYKNTQNDNTSNWQSKISISVIYNFLKDKVLAQTHII